MKIKLITPTMNKHGFATKQFEWIPPLPIDK